MVNSTWIPSSYTTRWRAARRQSLPQPPTQAASGSPVQVYNSSCTHCARSRVRCSGGKPCERCGKNLLDPFLCVYEPSRRHGKRRARGVEVEPLTKGGGTDQQPTAIMLPKQDSPIGAPLSASSPFDFDPSELSNSPPSTLAQHGQTLGDNGSMPTPSTFNIDTVSLDESLLITEKFTAISNDIGTMPFSWSSEFLPAHFDGSDEVFGYHSVHSPSNSCDCHESTQSLLSRLTLASVEPGKIGLDEILISFEEVARHVVTYLNCTCCDSGYPRLMNIAMLHQSQVTLLCNMTKCSAAYLGSYHSPEAVRFTLGVYQLPEADDLHQKRLAILAVGRKVESLVADFDDVVRSHQDLEIAGSTGASDLAKINLKWLLEISRNLKAQLKSILAIFEQAECLSGLSKSPL
ncbi:hypothetical protein O1611_g6244 [Lasiodiplodia mahajangana]|uniref:Uncharacterized protein n=1 Tax=Lasiodiplodia mahajangana TaxID=1108764 RepID=A0ACC2JIW3_9PEZI|nr:hypothetical protein O1611_g6244 [Lasiodiplodia mahajangana]